MFEFISSLQEYEKVILQNEAVLFYFSHEQCIVCKVLKPKIVELIENEFPEIKLYYCDTVKLPEIAAQNQIFAVPSLLIFFSGKEFIRKSRNMGIGDLRNEIERPYSMLFNS